MTLLALVVIIFAIGVIVTLAQRSGWVSQPFLQIGTYVAVAGVVLYLVYVLLVWAGALDAVTNTRLP